MEVVDIQVKVEGPDTDGSSAGSRDSLVFAADGSSYYDEDFEGGSPHYSMQDLLVVPAEGTYRFSVSQPVTPVEQRDTVVVVQPQGLQVQTIQPSLRAACSAPEIRQPPRLNSHAAMPFNLRVLLKLNTLSVSSEWISECSFDSCCGCCLACVANEVTVHVRSASGSELFRIQLTGALGKEPLDTADVVTADGVVVARIAWVSPYFEVVDCMGEPLIKMKLRRFLVCTLNMSHKVLDGQNSQVLGTIDATFTMFGPSWSSGYNLVTNIHPNVDLKRRLAWIALMFVLKLTHRGREYAKVIRVD